MSTLSHEDFQKARRISRAIQDFLVFNKLVEARSSDVYEYLARKGLIEKDRHHGLFFRNFLKELYHKNYLHIIPQCKYIPDKNGYGSWHFYRCDDNQTTKIVKDDNVKHKIITPKISEIEINEIIAKRKNEIDNLPKNVNREFNSIELYIRSTYSRAFEFWSKKELDILMQSFQEFGRYDKVAELLRRQPHVVKDKINESQYNENIEQTSVKIDDSLLSTELIESVKKIVFRNFNIICDTVSPDIKKIREKYYRYKEPWCNEEIALLKNLYKLSDNIIEIASCLGRDNSDIEFIIKKHSLFQINESKIESNESLNPIIKMSQEIESIQKPLIQLYSDGGASPNPGKGGFGVILKFDKHLKEFSEGYELTTNNRMEILGVIYGLEQLKKPCIVQVYSDSKYVVDAIEQGWVLNWKAKNWFKGNKEKAENVDLWERLLIQLQIHDVHFNWIKGHNGHPENERCDVLVNTAFQKSDLKVDSGYINRSNEPIVTYKILQEGDLCRKCNTPVIKKHPKQKEKKENQSYYYEYYLFCPQCKNMYMVDEAKRSNRTS